MFEGDAEAGCRPADIRADTTGRARLRRYSQFTRIIEDRRTPLRPAGALRSQSVPAAAEYSPK
jgi:hypothetical protein